LPAPAHRPHGEPARDAGPGERPRRRLVGRLQHSLTAMDIETVCIIGGAGFVGRSVADQACAAGYRVRVVTRSRPRARHLMVLPTLEVMVADVNADAGLERALDGMDAVINLAGVLAPKG